MRLGSTTNNLIPRLNQCVGYLWNNREPKNHEPTFMPKRITRNSLRCPRSIGSSLRTKGSSCHWKILHSQVINAVEKLCIERRPKTGAPGINLLHENASSHQTKQVANHIEEIRMHALDHPPYSPILSPCDIWLLSNLKKDFLGKNIDTRLDIGHAIHKCLKDISEEEYKKKFHCWIERLKLSSC